jgi:hypothetical protein
MKNMQMFGKKSSGGIALTYKKELLKDIFIHKPNNEFVHVLWFEISRAITNTGKKILSSPMKTRNLVIEIFSVY